MSMLQDIRERFSNGELSPSKGDGMLYLSARMHDAEDEAKQYLKLAHATEMAAIDIIRRYDGDGSLVREFEAQIDVHKRHML